MCLLERFDSTEACRNAHTDIFISLNIYTIVLSKKEF